MFRVVYFPQFLGTAEKGEKKKIVFSDNEHDNWSIGANKQNLKRHKVHHRVIEADGRMHHSSRLVTLQIKLSLQATVHFMIIQQFTASQMHIVCDILI